MQRITRMPMEELSAETRVLFAHYDELRALLRPHLPPSTLTLFARPVPKADNYVEWYSDLEGQPLLLAPQSAEFARADKLIRQRLADIQALHNALLAQGAIKPEQSRLLSQLTAIAGQQEFRVYLINHEPVIVNWQVKPEPVNPPVTPPIQAKSGFRWWWLLLLLLLLAAGLVWWWFNAKPASTPQPFVAIMQEAKLEPKLKVAEIPFPDYKKPEPQAEPQPEVKPPAPPQQEKPKKEAPKEEAAKKTPPKAEPPKKKTLDTALQVGKKWHGKYYCNGRMALMTIEVIKRTGNRVVALERWDYGPGEVGVVYLEGVLTDKVFNAKETRWHSRPQKGSGWYFTSFQGSFDPKRNIFYGRVPEAGCTTFEMRESK